ncbi:hypothetical protein VAPA_1c44710 [Variovorax paradoxus B4]|uniref:Uncharacterized protein n=1 Tax=Variovorax paradoxus B4 TaxID=1246301 RepID=T1XGT4_VARPD|nr:hypothetical protein [Variovorax paradoxus]AGU51544.1 hypothetical protein VAPA_1c44710 [Variovorax paradoxus B4]
MQTSETHALHAAAAPGAPTLGERIDAIEKFLEQLVVLLEVEPDLSRANIAAWLEIVGASARAHGLQTPRQQAAMELLCSRVLAPSFELVQSCSR